MEVTDPFILDVSNGNCLGFASTSVANNSQMDKIRPQLNSCFPRILFFYITMPIIKKKLTKCLNLHRIILWYLHEGMISKFSGKERKATCYIILYNSVKALV